MLTHEIELVELEPQPALVVRGHVPIGGIPEFIGGAFGDVMAAMGQAGVSPAGPPFGRYLVTPDGFDVEAGFPVEHAVEPSGRVESSMLPGGTAARTMHVGGYDGVAAAYEAVSSWLYKEGYAAAGAPWESYLDGPDVPEPRTLVVAPCRKVRL
jgi:effector-binding domain-containing protein